MHWQIKRFSELSKNELYDLLKLRVDVFVVEQCCYYPELDNLDRLTDSLHLLGYHENNLAAYLRILPPDSVYPNCVAIGRVAVAKSARGKGFARQLMQQSIKAIEHVWPSHQIKISAQCYLQAFYQEFGFKVVSEPYLEDGIEHIAMLRENSTTKLDKGIQLG